MNVIAGSWLIASVFSDLTMAMSSTIAAVCGNSSLTQVPALAVLRELEHRGGTGKRLLPGGHAGDALAHADRRRQLVAVQLLELRLVVEQVDVGRPAGHEQVDDPLRLGRQVQRLQHPGPILAARNRPISRTAASSAIEQRRQGRRADAGGRAAEELAASGPASVWL